MSPRVFISYSWSSKKHRDRIRQWAEHMMRCGVDVVLDVWNLEEGNDKYVFMEKMVTDESITHVLIISDSEYAAKADAREAGVGTESQIISREVYSKSQQSKFIPVVCEFDDSGEPFLPIFLKSRIWIDFSSLEAVDKNWKQLIRLFYGKPAHEKPALGKAPTYVTTNITVPVSTMKAKFAALRQAIIQEKRGLKLYRQEFLDACYIYADALRIRERPDVTNIGERVLEDCGKLKLVRDHIVDWVLLESKVNPPEEFREALIAMLERLLELKSRPPEIKSWNDVWFEAHCVFVYEIFLYIVAALIETGSFSILHIILTIRYLLPETEARGPNQFDTFKAFYCYSKTIQMPVPEGNNLRATAELIRRQADRVDLPFKVLMQAELLILMMAFITDGARWYPQTLIYSLRAGTFPFFVSAAQQRNFQNLARITGIDSVDDLRKAMKAGHQRLQVNQWNDFPWMNFLGSMNMDALDTLK